MSLGRRIFCLPERLPTVSPQGMRCVHFWLFLVWTAALPVTLAFGWVYSVAFVSAASIYANLAAHLSGWSAERPTETEE